MSERLIRVPRDETGSLPLALLAGILVAGLISVLFVRIGTGERTVRFDRSYTEAIQIADAGINQVLFRLNEGQVRKLDGTVPGVGESVTGTRVVDGITYEWTATRSDFRTWSVTSTAVGPDADRTIVATMEEHPLFFPGAFGDKIVALNGNSTEVDSYNSGGCLTPASMCRWGTDPHYGTVNGSLGTNEDFVFAGTPVRPGGAFLYDWEDNPPTGVTATDPFGSRCDGPPCTTTTFVSTIPHRLDYASDAQMAFITDKFATGGACEGTPAQRAATPKRFKDSWKLGTKKKEDITLVSYADAAGVSPGVAVATDPAFTNFYCAESLEIVANIELAASVTSDNPVVIFVKDFIDATSPNNNIACHDGSTGDACSADDLKKEAHERVIRPEALRLQLYSAGLPAGASLTASNVKIAAGMLFAGVIYAPRSSCGNGGSGGLDVYGAVICGLMDQVGNWNFHYDDALGARGTGEFNVAAWREDI